MKLAHQINDHYSIYMLIVLQVYNSALDSLFVDNLRTALSIRIQQTYLYQKKYIIIV